MDQVQVWLPLVGWVLTTAVTLWKLVKAKKAGKKAELGVRELAAAIEYFPYRRLPGMDHLQLEDVESVQKALKGLVKLYASESGVEDDVVAPIVKQLPPAFEKSTGDG